MPHITHPRSAFGSTWVWVLLIGAGCCASTAMAADERPFIDEPVPMSELRPDQVQVEEWQEELTLLPDYPGDEDLLEFQVDRPDSPFRYLIDATHLDTSAEDGVIRFTLLLESRRGARNVSFEGIRCSTRDYKVFAYGDGRGAFHPTHLPEWQAISSRDADPVRVDLLNHYLCRNGIPRERDEILRRLGASLTGANRRNHWD